MFPHRNAPTNAAPPRPLSRRLRRALDVVIAFATLADAAPDRRPVPGSLGPAADRLRPALAPEYLAPAPAEVIPPATPGARARAGTREITAPAPWTSSASRGAPAAGRAPQPPGSARGPRAAARGTQPRHPHRLALRAPTRIRRPGAVRAAPQPCLTPLPARHAGRGRTPLAPSR